MGDLQDNFKKIINDLEQNIQNKEDLDYIKTQIFNISNLFLDELDKLADLNMNKMNSLIARYKQMSDRMNKIEESMNHIEKDIYLEEEPYEFEIICPYCNTEFFTDITTDSRNEVTCPECHNVIELDWNEGEHNHDDHECSGSCGHCSSHSCQEEQEEAEDEEEEIDEDDM